MAEKETVINGGKSKFYTDDINYIELNHLESGGRSNEKYCSWLQANPNIKREKFNSCLTLGENGLNELIDIIFNSKNMSEDQFRTISLFLTFFDAIVANTGADASYSNANDLYFALLVNYNVVHNNSVEAMRIKSIQGLIEARGTCKRDDKGNLDFREYIINGDPVEFNELKNGTWEKVSIKLPFCSSDILLRIPLIKRKFGSFNIATSRIALTFQFIADGTDASYIIPADVWLPLIKDKMNNRRRTSFTILEKPFISKLFEFNRHNLIPILQLNSFRKNISLFAEPGMGHQYEFGYNGLLEVYNTQEPPNYSEYENRGFKWHRDNGHYFLQYYGHNSDFYVAINAQEVYDVYTQ